MPPPIIGHRFPPSRLLLLGRHLAHLPSAFDKSKKTCRTSVTGLAKSLWYPPLSLQPSNAGNCKKSRDSGQNPETLNRFRMRGISSSLLCRVVFRGAGILPGRGGRVFGSVSVATGICHTGWRGGWSAVCYRNLDWQQPWVSGGFPNFRRCKRDLGICIAPPPILRNPKLDPIAKQFPSFKERKGYRVGVLECDLLICDLFHLKVPVLIAGLNLLRIIRVLPHHTQYHYIGIGSAER